MGPYKPQREERIQKRKKKSEEFVIQPVKDVPFIQVDSAINVHECDVLLRIVKTF